jgi:hydrogenase maturation protease
MTTPRILVAGIGNIFLGDDAFGCEVARRLARETFPDEVRVTDFGIRSLDLAFAMLDGVERTIFIDATARGGAPGTLYTIEPDCNIVPVDMDAHGMNPMSVLGLVKAMGGELPGILIVGCGPESCEERMGLSETVAASVDAAAGMVRELILEAEHESRNDPQRHGAGGGDLRNLRQPA